MGTDHRDTAILKTVGMRGLQVHENMIERQLAKYGLKPPAVCDIVDPHLRIEHAGKDDQLP